MTDTTVGEDFKKAQKLHELFPDVMTIQAALTWFPVRPEYLESSASDHPIRRRIVEAVKLIEDGVIDSPLWKALE